MQSNFFRGDGDVEVQIPSFRQLITENYEINKIQANVKSLALQTNNYVASLSTQRTVVSLTSPLNFTFNGGLRNAYVIFNNPVFDPFGAFNASTGLFSSPIQGVIQVSADILVTGVTGTYQLLVQLNKAGITPVNAPITNYDYRLSYSDFGTSGHGTLSGIVFVPVNQGDTIALVYTSTVNATSFNASPDSQVAFSW